jgi:hypothetical protein
MCDDLRREDNGKLLLIGMYTGTMGLPQLPFVLPSLTFVMFMDSDRPGHWAMKFRIQHLETGKLIVEGAGGMMFQQPGLSISPLKFGGIPISAIGDYNFVVNLEDHTDPIIVDFKIVLNLPNQQPNQQPLRF